MCKKSITMLMGLITGFILFTSGQAGAFSENDLEKLLNYQICYSCDLSGVDLSGKDLSRNKLIMSDLSGAYLNGCDLSYADFSNADLSGAELIGVTMKDTCFIGAIPWFETEFDRCGSSSIDGCYPEGAVEGRDY